MTVRRRRSMVATIYAKGGSTVFTALGGIDYDWSNGETTASITVTNAGDYTVTVTDATGCTSTGTRTLTINNNPIATISGATEICTGANTTWIASGGVDYEWSNTETNGSVTVSIAGDYTVTVTDANGCTDSATLTLSTNDSPTATISGSNNICEGGSTVFTALGGASYEWSNGFTTESITVSDADDYTVTVTDATGCTSTGTRTLTINNNPTATITGATEICSGANTTWIASGGVDYEWSNNETNGSITVSIAGDYTVTVTDANGCTDSATMTLSTNDSPTATISGINNICEGGSTVFTALGGASYEWSNGFTTESITVSDADDYTVTVTDASGCTSTGTRTLTINNNPTATITGATEICSGANTTWIASGGVDYEWSNNETNGSITVSIAGDYTVTVTDANGCTDSTTLTLSTNDSPSATINGSNNICEGGSTVFTALGGIDYDWSNGETTASITVTNAGDYTVTVTDATGCTSTGTRTLTINNNPIATISGATEICTGANTTWIASGGVDYEWSNTETNGSVTVSIAGDYTVTVTDANGCTDSATLTLSTNDSPTATISGSNNICEGGSTVFTALGGASYEWSNGFTTESITVSDADDYTVTVTDATGCTSTGTRTLTINNNPTATITGATEICSGANTTWIASGGVDYEWSNNETNGSITVSIAGDYTVTVTDANGCTDSATMTLSTNDSPTATISGINNICEGGSTVFTALGGASYEWSNGFTTESITVSDADDYTVTVTDASGCTSTGTRTLTINDNPTAAITGATEICTGANTTWIASGGVDYEWSNTETNGSITVSIAGDYTVTVTDANGCTSSATQTLSTNDSPTATISGSNNICEGGSTVFTALGGIDYDWSNGEKTASITVTNAGDYTVTVTDATGCTSTGTRSLTINNNPTAVISGATEICSGANTTWIASGGTSYVWSNLFTTGSITVSTAGDYTVTVTDANGCTDSATLTLSTNDNPTATISGSNNICEGGSAVFTALGGVDYDWSNGETTASINITNAGDYTVTVTDATGCTSTGTRTLTINNNPTAVISGATEICIGANTTWIASGGTSYVWSNLFTTGSITVSTAGDYTVTVTDANGCTDSTTLTLSTNDSPTATISGVNNICEGGSTVFTALGGASYEWSTNETTSDITVNTAGSYTVTVTDASGCTSTGTRTLTINDNPTAAITGATEICSGANTTWIASGGVDYEWSNTETNGSITVSIAGDYTVTVTDANGCTDSTTLTLSTSDSPTATISGVNNICEGESAVFTALGGVDYDWSNGEATASITVTNTGDYTVTVTDATGCTSTGTRTLTINSNPTAAITGATEICTGANTTWIANGGVDYEWSNNETNSSITISTAGDYTVTVTDANGCTDSTTLTLSTNDSPTATISGVNNICEGESAVFTALGGADYDWSNGEKTASITVTNAGDYTVTVTDATGCTSTGTRTLTINNNPIATISGATEICSGANTTWIASGGTSYVWSNLFTTGSITVSTAGDYTVTVTDANGCTDSTTLTLSTNDSPIATISGSNNICEGGSAVFTALGGVDYDWSNGETIASITVTNAGDYTVTVTDATGCTSIGTRTLTINNNPIATISGATEICSGANTTWIASGGTSYVWSNLFTTGSITVSTAGDYTVTVTDANGCTDSTTLTLSTNDSPTATISGSNNICEGESAVFTALGGVDYDWSNGEKTASITVTNAGDYTVTVTDATGCTSIGTRTLTINNNPIATISGATEICSGANTTWIASGGTSYGWSNLFTTGSITVSTAGDYTVTVTDANGCTDSATQTLSTNDSPTATISGSNNICEGGSAVFTALGGIDYDWSNGEKTASITVTNAGDYTVTVTDATGCTSAGTRTLTINDNPTAAISGATEICSGANTTWIASGGTSYVWSNLFTTGSITVSTAGDYTVTVTDANGCTDSTTLTLALNSLPVVSILGMDVICKGSTATFRAIGGDQYSWSSNMSGSEINVSSAGIYTVTVTDVNGCTATASKELKENPLPVAIISGVNEICSGTNAVWTASGGLDYKWSNGFTGAEVILENSGVYIVSVTDGNGCISTTQATLNVIQQPDAGQNLSLHCVELPGGSVRLNGVGTGVWSANSGNPGSVFIFNPVLANTELTNFSNSGVYTFVYTNGICKDEVNVEVTGKPNAGTDPNMVECYYTGSITMNAQGNGVWSLGSGSVGSAEIVNPSERNSVVRNFSTSGTYQLIWTNNMCSDTAYVVVNNNCACPIANNRINEPEIEIFCVEAINIRLTGSDASPSDGKYHWEYSFNGSNFAPAEGINDTKEYITGVLKVGTHAFRRVYSVDYPPFCSDISNEVSILVISEPDAPFELMSSHDPICLGDTITFWVKGQEGASFTWSASSPTAGLKSKTGNSAQMIPNQPGSYTISVTQNYGNCPNDSKPAQLNVVVNELPELNIGRDTTICDLDGGLYLYAGEHNSISWSDGSSNRDMFIRSKGKYSVIVTDQNGCQNYDEITVKNFCCKIFHPNIISLGSNRNNNFSITETSCVISSKISIYDRWGNLVFKSENGLDPWDGTYKGVPVELGVYVFIFTYEALDEDDQPFNDKVAGDITVIR
ncbi:MAG: gliding motility-associated C-terminal domain-containing protein [Saprospiraceae bacterium]|nr:gliding motility-associated C-terminal domain-containing protein [Saprospiraceae bacterium]